MTAGLVRAAFSSWQERLSFAVADGGCLTVGLSAARTDDMAKNPRAVPRTTIANVRDIGLLLS